MNFFQKTFLFLLFVSSCIDISSNTAFSAETPVTRADCLTYGDKTAACSNNCAASGKTQVGTCTDDTQNPLCCMKTYNIGDKCGSNEQGVCREYTSSNNGCNNRETGIGECASATSMVTITCCMSSGSVPVDQSSCETQGGTCDANTTGATNGNCSSGTKIGECKEKNQNCCKATTSSTTTDPATASLTYNTLENLPGFEGSSSDFPTYLKNLYLLALWIVGICALFMLVLGGFLYLSSAGNTALISSAKKTITGALIGLVIALITWLILNTINPSLTTIDLNSLSLAGGSSSNGSTGGSTTPASGDVDKAGCEALSNNGVKSQCGLASKEIVQVLSCMQGKGAAFSISSLTSQGTQSNQQQSAACCGVGATSTCPHSATSCHHGCTYGTKGLSYAADLSGNISTSTSDTALCKIAEAAKSCGAGSNIWGPKNVSCNGVSITKYAGHETHLHISTAGCNH